MNRILFIVVASVLLVACSSTSTPTAQRSATAQASSVQQARRPDLIKASRLNVQLGLGYLRQGDNVRAKRKLLSALEQNPNSFQAQGAMAYFLEKTGDMAEAATYYQRAMSLAPGRGEPLNNYGAFLCRQKQYRESIAYFEKAVTDKRYIKSAAAYENAGLCAERIPDVAQAKQFFQRAIAQNPKQLQSLVGLAQLFYQEEAYQKAQFYLDKRLQLAKSDAATALLAYRLARHFGRLNKAASYALLLRSEYPDSREYAQLKQVRQS